MLNESDLKVAAAAAIRTMGEKERAAFIRSYEEGSEIASMIAKAFAIEGVQRQIRLAMMALENSKTMDALVGVVAENL